MPEQINLTELRAEAEESRWPEPTEVDTTEIMTDDLLALIDTAEATYLYRKNGRPFDLRRSDHTLDRYTFTE